MADQKQDQDVQQQMQRLQKARVKAEELSREKSRITGELGALQNQMKDLETKCKTDFDCTINDLPAFITRLKDESGIALTNAEIILGMREGTVVVPKPQEVSTPIPAPERPRMAPRVAPVARPVLDSGHDEDGLP